MKTLDLKNKKVTKGTEKLICEYLYKNNNSLSNEVEIFYHGVAGMIAHQLKKPVKRRMTMNQILERVYNIEKYLV